MSELKFTKEHEWVKKDGDFVYVGITDHAQEALGDIVFVELPEVGNTFETDEDCAVVESVKAASDIYCPIAGEIVEVNDILNDQPELVNEDWTTWFFKLKVFDWNEYEDLMDEAEYNELISE